MTSIEGAARNVALRNLRLRASGALLAGILATALLGLASDWREGLAGGVAARAILLYLALGLAILLGLAAHLPQQRFGAANAVTLARLVLICWLAGLLGRAGSTELTWLPFAGALTVLLLDGVDGYIARRRGLASAFGARFDMECDALFMLVLSGLLLASGRAGSWVLALGLLRYLFLAAGLLVTWMQRPLPPSFRRKLLFVLSAALMLTGLAPVLSPSQSEGLAAIALAMIVLSFARDSIWLLMNRGGKNKNVGAGS